MVCIWFNDPLAVVVLTSNLQVACLWQIRLKKCSCHHHLIASVLTCTTRRLLKMKIIRHRSVRAVQFYWIFVDHACNSSWLVWKTVWRTGSNIPGRWRFRCDSFPVHGNRWSALLILALLLYLYRTARKKPESPTQSTEAETSSVDIRSSPPITPVRNKRVLEESPQSERSKR